jgi:hypothetical protein
MTTHITGIGKRAANGIEKVNIVTHDFCLLPSYRTLCIVNQAGIS